MVASRRVITQKGLTLIEILVVLAITSILSGVVIFAFHVVFDSYHFVQDDIFLQKTLDEILREVTSGDFVNYGIKDSLEILEASNHAVTFVPLWVDDGHIAKVTVNGPQKFILSRPLKAGSALPIGEVLIKKIPAPVWKQYPLTFSFREDHDPFSIADTVMFDAAIPAGARVRFIFQPDAARFPGCRMTIRKKNGRILRTYKKKTQPIPRYALAGVVLVDMQFRYFDNTNTEIPFDGRDGGISEVHISDITAVRLTVTVKKGSAQKEGSVFINIRNTRASGKGLIIRKGTRMKIPDSRRIRTFSLTNIVGVKEGGRITLEARSLAGRTWKVTAELGVKDHKGTITRYVIEYPSGNTVYAETVNLTTDLPLNFLTIGGNGRYDYDFDEDAENVVDLEGETELNVREMDAAGAALFIRP